MRSCESTVLPGRAGCYAPPRRLQTCAAPPPAMRRPPPPTHTHATHPPLQDAGGKPSEPEVPAGHELLQARIRSTRGAATSSSDLSDAELDAELAGIHSSANAKQLLSLQAAKHVATRIRNARHTVRVKLLDRRLSAQRRGAAGGAAAAGDPSATAGAAAAAAAAAGAQDPCSWQLDTFIDQCLDELVSGWPLGGGRSRRCRRWQGSVAVPALPCTPPLRRAFAPATLSHHRTCGPCPPLIVSSLFPSNLQPGGQPLEPQAVWPGVPGHAPPAPAPDCLVWLRRLQGPRLHRGDEASLMSRVMRQVATKIVLDELHALADRSISAAKRIRDDGVLGLQ